MRDVPRRARDTGHGAPFVKLDQRLRQIEIDGPAPLPFAIQNQRQLTHHFETRDQTGVALTQPGVSFEQQVDIGIGHGLDAADHTSREFLRHQVASMVEFEQRGHDQAIHLRIERADVGGKLEGQHGNCTIWKVDAGPS